MASRISSTRIRYQLDYFKWSKLCLFIAFLDLMLNSRHILSMISMSQKINLNFSVKNLVSLHFDCMCIPF